MKLVKFIDAYFEEILMTIILIIITAIMFLQIVARYVFHNAFSWPEELCRYVFIWMSFIGISYSIKCRNPLRVDILELVMPKAGKRVLRIIADLSMFLFCAALFYYGIYAMQRIYTFNQISPTLEIPMTWVYVSLLVGSVLGLLRQIQNFILDIISFTKNKGTPGDIPTEALEGGEA